jgi:CBS domain-containing protein
MMNELIQSRMTKEVKTLSPEHTLGDARDIFMQKSIHHLPIVNAQRELVGLVTSWDIFKLGKSVEDYRQIKVNEVMTTKLATLQADDHLGAAAEVLMRHLFHAVPIVDAANKLVGIITTYDLLKYEFEKEYPENLDKFVPENM